ncbi:hypothetical protein B0T16DRAFT_414706 [Cercophora newfieldiana]|uniref:NACHT domain-containing protein n=1 Tax=Cercophora newfieldiana TaxID=92897 RepID=A0AA40CQ18_9PEZI|nr:hypothetical protein B0T16DRAFT_414706 [Cercophora newfieldiana]
MAEAVATLSLVANILQILDCGREFVQTALGIWCSDDIRAESFAPLNVVSSDLHNAVQHLQIPTSDGDAEIVKLAQECSKVSNDMLESIKKLGLGATLTKWEGARAAFRRVWSKAEIDALDAKLEKFRGQLTLRLLISIRSYASQSVANQQAILQRLMDSDSNREAPSKEWLTLDSGFGFSAVQYVASKVGTADPLAALDDGERLQHQLSDAAVDGVLHSPIHTESSQQLVVPPARERKLEQAFLSLLAYEGMLERESNVAMAHEKTFNWIFNPTGKQTWVDFPAWLKSANQLYWVTGKAGSGKSTLMKFVSQPSSDGLEPRCMRYLRHWAQGRLLVIATFYFWASGRQTESDAMFRTLLHQILSRFPELIRVASPGHWDAMCLFGTTPNLSRVPDSALEAMLLRTLAHLAGSLGAAVCLFIDGLDEFSGKPDALVALLKRTVQQVPIKVCVSSRPWQVFEDSFESQPSLRVEDLTIQDIKDFITAKFEEDANFSQLRSRERAFSDRLVDEVAKKSSGVFLWVSLVVVSLLEGMRCGDRISDLQRRLEDLPPDLEDLYDRILHNLDPFYLQHAAQYFSLMETSCIQPTALLFSFCDEDDPDFALKLPVKDLPPEDVEIRIDTMRRRVNSRCKGLLEVSRSYTGTDFRQTTVHYLHKTVRDYMQGSKSQRLLAGEAGATFDPWLSLCAASLAAYKTGGQQTHYLFSCLRHASGVHPRNIPNMVAILDNLDIASYKGSTLSQISGELLYEYFLSLRQPVVVKRDGVEVTWPPDQQCSLLYSEGNRVPQTFLSRAIQCGALEYVRIRAGAQCLPAHPKRWSRFIRKFGKTSRFWERPRADSPQPMHPLLLDALQLHSPVVSSAMVQMLLETGADPNADVELWRGNKRSISMSNANTTIWIYTLATIIFVFSRDFWDPAIRPVWEEITRLMLSHGARCDRETVHSCISLLKSGNSPLAIYVREQDGDIGIQRTVLEALQRCKGGRPMGLAHWMRFGPRGRMKPPLEQTPPPYRGFPEQS